jgi:hypothetical protein
MTKNKTERVGEPAAVAVPWGNTQTTPTIDEVADQIEAMGDTQPDFVGDPEASKEQVVDPEFADKIRAAFTGQPIEQASPFAPKPKAAPAPAPQKFDLGDAPSWGQLVAFVQRHGDVIIQARYPAPLGEAVDTMYRGVTVIAHPTCELRHVKLGWIKWADAQYESA